MASSLLLEGKGFEIQAMNIPTPPPPPNLQNDLRVELFKTGLR